MVTSRRIIDNLLRGSQAPRVGFYDGPWVDTLPAWAQQGYPMRQVQKQVGEKRWCVDGRWVDVEVAGEYAEPEPFWEHFGVDIVGAGGWFDWMPLRGHSELLDETDEWAVRRNGAGASIKDFKHKSGGLEHIDFRMTTRAIWERDYRPYLLALDPERYNAQALALTRKTLAHLRQVGGWSFYLHQFVWQNMSQSMGEATMFPMLLLDPEWIHDYCRVYTDFYKMHYTYLFEQAGFPDGIFLCDDLGYKNGLFASPRVLSELVFPYYKEIVDFFHSYDLPVILHSCGGIAQALPLIIEAGFDALNPMERKAEGIDPFALAERYGDKLTFIGGLDARVLETNDKEIVRREVSAYMEGMKARGARLVYAADAGISSAVHYDTYSYAVAVYREHMLY